MTWRNQSHVYVNVWRKQSCLRLNCTEINTLLFWSRNVATAESSELRLLCWTMQFAHKQTYAYFSCSVIRNSCICCLPPDGAVVSIVPISNCSGDTIHFIIGGNARLICSVCLLLYRIAQPYGALLCNAVGLSRSWLHYLRQNGGPYRKNLLPSTWKQGFIISLQLLLSGSFLYSFHQNCFL
jgi:hypothetical protein